MARAGKWTPADIPDQSGRIAVVTGANSGLGLSTARELARAGASVIMACRNADKAQGALEQLTAAAPTADARVELLDLADLGSVRAFADRLAGGLDHLDLLVNNAGIMAPPRRLTVDGFESQLGTNHLGHFALTGLVLPLLSQASQPRVVTLSSLAHKSGQIKFEDLQREHRYNNWLAYGQSKLANLLFCLELQRRAQAAGSPLLSVASHPGLAATNLQFAGPARFYERWVLALGNQTLAQSADMGALPTLYAATMPDLAPATFVGPDGIGEARGHPKVVQPAAKARDDVTARRLWEESERLTGVHYDFGVPATA